MFVDREVIEEVISSGLFSDDEHAYFSRLGCDYCASGLGQTVYDVHGYRNLEDAHRSSEQFEFQLCAECLCNLYYGKLL